MEKIYKSIDGLYYTFKNNKYHLLDIILKRNTIVCPENGNIVDSIKIKKIYTFQELKKEFLINGGK